MRRCMPKAPRKTTWTFIYPPIVRRWNISVMLCVAPTRLRQYKMHTHSELQLLQLSLRHFQHNDEVHYCCRSCCGFRWFCPTIGELFCTSMFMVCFTHNFPEGIRTMWWHWMEYVLKSQQRTQSSLLIMMFLCSWRHDLCLRKRVH